MTARNVVKLVCAAAIAAGGMGGCKCRQDVGTGDEPRIETTPIAEEYPDVPTPKIDFPARWHSEDTTLNAFIDHALKVCGEGDYDGFRQLFGTEYTPTGRSDFERAWHAFSDIKVTRLFRGPQDPPAYYLHVVVRRREPDRKGRRQRDAVVMVFREAGDWRLGPAPKEIVRKVLAASTRPAGTRPAAGRQSPSQTRPSDGIPTRGKDSP